MKKNNKINAEKFLKECSNIIKDIEKDWKFSGITSNCETPFGFDDEDELYSEARIQICCFLYELYRKNCREYKITEYLKTRLTKKINGEITTFIKLIEDGEREDEADYGDFNNVGFSELMDVNDKYYFDDIFTDIAFLFTKHEEISSENDFLKISSKIDIKNKSQKLLNILSNKKTAIPFLMKNGMPTLGGLIKNSHDMFITGHLNEEVKKISEVLDQNKINTFAYGENVVTELIDLLIDMACILKNKVKK